ncbi:hypothetical protein MLD38_031245 [Melastoma candidum]|uniref:Uncharacterized protein n=1 Tax=Melastoma candidum TaxID=119954 RepID=A0ACB9MP51_9MYRT|nr:hypothetical protein MLD38_031245 [Melastoma candidum]
MGRLKSVWGEHSMEVKPERWISKRGGIRREPSYKFLSFNAGPKSCLGRVVALRQLKIITAFVVYNYNVQVIEGQSIVPLNSIIVKIEDGLSARVKKRSVKFN